MKKFAYFLLILLLTFLYSCGSSSSDKTLSSDQSTSEDVQTDTVVIQGVAASGLPVIGKAYIKDGEGNEYSADTDRFGKYYFDPIHFRPPYIVKAEGLTGDRFVTLYSVSDGKDKIVNTNPYTNLAASLVVGGENLDDVYKSPENHKDKVSKEKIDESVNKVKEMLKPVLDEMKIGDFDPFNKEYAADGKDIDGILDNIDIKVDGSNFRVVDSSTGTMLIDSDIGDIDSQKIDDEKAKDIAEYVEKGSDQLSEINTFLKDLYFDRSREDFSSYISDNFQWYNGVSRTDILSTGFSYFAGVTTINNIFVTKRISLESVVVSLAEKMKDGNIHQQYYKLTKIDGKWFLDGNGKKFASTINPVTMLTDADGEETYTYGLDLSFADPADLGVSMVVVEGAGLPDGGLKFFKNSSGKYIALLPDSVNTFGGNSIYMEDFDAEMLDADIFMEDYDGEMRDTENYMEDYDWEMLDTSKTLLSADSTQIDIETVFEDFDAELNVPDIYLLDYDAELYGFDIFMLDYEEELQNKQYFLDYDAELLGSDVSRFGDGTIVMEDFDAELLGADISKYGFSEYTVTGYNGFDSETLLPTGAPVQEQTIMLKTGFQSTAELSKNKSELFLAEANTPDYALSAGSLTASIDFSNFEAPYAAIAEFVCSDADHSTSQAQEITTTSPVFEFDIDKTFDTASLRNCYIDFRYQLSSGMIYTTQRAFSHNSDNARTLARAGLENIIQQLAENGIVNGTEILSSSIDLPELQPADERITIRYNSSNSDYLLPEGTVHRPDYFEEDEHALLHVISAVDYGGAFPARASSSVSLIIMALGATEYERSYYDDTNLDFDAIRTSKNTSEDEIRYDLNLYTEGELGTDISWESSNADVISTDGTVNRPAHKTDDEAVTLTASIQYPGFRIHTLFELTVKAESGDTDGDGQPDDEDLDDDGDGYNDAIDAFPLIAGEWDDTDEDGLGNNTDLDDDDDGILDIYDAAPLTASRFNRQPLKTGQAAIFTAKDDGYYKLGADSAFSRDSATGLVTDSSTELIWQDTAAVAADTYGWEEAVTYCEELEIEGLTAWRLPTIEELKTILQPGFYRGKDETIFTQGSLKRFWSQDEFVSDSSSAWFSGTSGYINHTDKTEAINVRCVTGADFVEEREFYRNDDTSIVMDNSSGLMWQDNAAVTESLYSWEEAVEHCENLEFGGYKDWHLPNYNQLNTLVNYSAVSPAIFNVFQNMITAAFWNSTTSPTDPNAIMTTQFSSGANWIFGKDLHTYARCVRTIFVEEEQPAFIKQTGQTAIYKDKDDGYYQSGTPNSYTRDDEKEIVTDNVTGLEWQDNDIDSPGAVTWTGALVRCENLELGGYSDWRLPSREEVISIFDYGIHGYADSAFQNGSGSSNLWTSSTFVSNSDFAWYTRIYLGLLDYDDKSEQHDVRCVRGGSLPVRNFVREEYVEAVTDSSAKTMWQDDQSVIANTYTWPDAINHCENLTEGGYNDWRLPNILELLTIADPWAENPSLVPEFENFNSDYFWSSSTSVSGASSAYAIHNFYSTVIYRDVSESYYVRCIRDVSYDAIPEVAIKQTGQNASYAVLDDGYYLNGEEPDYTRSDNAIVTDSVTGLDWQDTIDVQEDTYTWSEALNNCEDMTLGGYQDWRLPSYHELMSIVKYGNTRNIDDTFEYLFSSGYWTATSTTDTPYSSARYVGFSNGYSDIYDKDLTMSARCVRGEKLPEHEFFRDDY
ncbi:MAG: hypothetical protein C0602_03345 [Denitrovibrio sp.]|nr:MAG: hypothetical protein C0602_03345 [Denitrovibrio sp.]